MNRREITTAWNELPSPRPSYVDAAAAIGTTWQSLASALSRCRRDDMYVAPKYDVEEILYDWDLLKSGGETVEGAAPRLGLSVYKLKEILADARRDGDPRGATNRRQS